MHIDGPPNARTRLILAHGSGADMNSTFMNTMAQDLSAQVKITGGFSVVRFNFPYMNSIIKSGIKRPPDRVEKLIESYKNVITLQIEDGAQELIIGGKSLGGRIASMVCDSEASVKALVCLGYPFHPPGKAEKLRTEHLYKLQTQSLICQGDRDIFGNKKEVPGYKLPDNLQIHWINDGDHSFIPRKKSAVTEVENLNQATKLVAKFIIKICG